MGNMIQLETLLSRLPFYTAPMPFGFRFQCLHISYKMQEPLSHAEHAERIQACRGTQELDLIRNTYRISHWASIERNG